MPGGSNAIVLSFVIPSLRPRRALLERCLVALGRETDGIPSEAILVVDDEEAVAGLDGFGTVNLTIRPIVQLGGAAVRRNAAFEVLSGDVVLLLDDDAEPLPGYGAALTARFGSDGSSEAHVVQGRIDPDFEEPLPAALESVAFRLGGFNAFGDQRRTDVFISANCGFHREVLDAVGPMRPDLGPGSGGVPWGDDTEWHARARAAGYVTHFDEALAVRHRVQKERVTETAVLDRAERVGRTLARLEWDDRRPGVSKVLHQRALAVWGGLKAGDGLEGRCLARRLAGYADELARIRSSS